MRILVLHGYSGRASWCKRSDKRFQWLIKPLGASLHHVNAPVPDPYCDDRFCWWRANDDGSLYAGWEETVAYLSEIFERDGPFDGILGHSQGAACAAVLAALICSGNFPAQLRFAIFTGGFLPRDPKLLSQFPIPVHHPETGWPDADLPIMTTDMKPLLRIPTMHIVGKADKTTPPEMNVALAARFESPVIVHHNGGHKMALDTATGRTYLTFLSQFAAAPGVTRLDSLSISTRILCSSCCTWCLKEELEDTSTDSPLESQRYYCRECQAVWDEYNKSEQRGADAPADQADNIQGKFFSFLGHCAQGCGHRISWHPTHCCIRCADTRGKEHDWGRCERRKWSSSEFDVHAFMTCFPSASTLAGPHGGIDALSVEAMPGNAAQAEKAAELFFKHGFVILRKAITAEAAGEVLNACCGVHAAAANEDPYRFGNRNPGRYSFNNCTASGNCLHVWPFVKHLVDNPFVLDVLDSIYGKPGPERSELAATDQGIRSSSVEEREAEPYLIARAAGDFCCGWVESFQKLHTDMANAFPLFGAPLPEEGPDGTPVFGWFGEIPLSAPAPLHDRARPPVITVNFAVQPLTRWNGAMRILTWEDMLSFATKEMPTPPGLFQELQDCPSWLASRIFPLEVGDALVRDARVWHGGCPNLSGETRYLPSVEVVSPEYDAWYQPLWEKQERSRCRFEAGGWALPLELAAKMEDPRARRRCRDVVEQKPDGDANRRVGDLGWVGGRVARLQWPKRVRAAELGSMEVELAGLLARLGKLSANSPTADEGAEFDLSNSRLEMRLKALKDGTFPIVELLGGSEADKSKCSEIAGMLQLALTNKQSLETVHYATTLADKLEELLSTALNTSKSADVEPGAIVKRQRIV